MEIFFGYVIPLSSTCTAYHKILLESVPILLYSHFNATSYPQKCGILLYRLHALYAYQYHLSLKLNSGDRISFNGLGAGKFHLGVHVCKPSDAR